MWLARHTEEKVMPMLTKVLDACKDADSPTPCRTAAAYLLVGYCFGGRYVLLLAGERPVNPQGDPGITLPWTSQKQADEESNNAETVGPLIKAGVVAHATLVSKGDFTGLEVAGQPSMRRERSSIPGRGSDARRGLYDQEQRRA